MQRLPQGRASLAEVKRAIESVTRADGMFFFGNSPELLQDYSNELHQFVLQPLMDQGMSRTEALLVDMSCRLYSIRVLLMQMSEPCDCDEEADDA